MTRAKAAGRINVKVLVLLGLSLAVVGGGAAGVHYYRKRSVAGDALQRGLAAFDKKEWGNAVGALRTYLTKFPDDVAILNRYAQCNLAVRPRKPETMAAAIGAYRRILRHKPGDQEICNHLARMYVQVQDYEEALYVCGQRLEADPRDKVAMLWKGKALAGAGRRDDARGLLRELVEKLDPQNVEAYIALSNIALQDPGTEAVKNVKAILDQAVEKCVRSASARAQRARFHRLVAGDHSRDGHPDKAKEALTAARADLDAADALKPADPTVRLALADEWTAHGEYDKARAELAAIPASDPKILADQDLELSDLRLPSRNAEAQIALRIGEAGPALALANEALKDLPSYARGGFLPNAVRLYLLGKDIPTARERLEEHRKNLGARATTDPAQHEEMTLLDAEIAQADGKPYEAIRLMKGLVSGSRRSAAALWGLWVAYRDLRQERMGTRWLEEYVSRVPSDAQANVALSRIYATRDPIKSFRYARAAEQLNPNSLDALLLRIQATLTPLMKMADSRDQILKIITDLNTVKTALPKSVAVRNLLAAALDAIGKSDEAVKELREAIQQCDAPLPASLQLADLLAAHQHVEEAMAACREAGAKTTDSARPWTKLAELLRQAKRIPEAKTALEEAAPRLKGEAALLVRRALAELMLGNDERPGGLTLLRGLCAEYPNDVDVRLSLLGQAELAKDATASQAIVDEIRKIEGDEGLNWQCEQAGVWLRTNQWKDRQADVVAKLTACIEADASWQQPVLYLGGLYDALGDTDKAIETYRASLEASSSNVAVANRLLELLERQQRFTEAADVLNRLPGKLASSPHAVSVALGREDYGAAVRELRGRIAADPMDGMSRTVLAGLIYNHRKDESVTRALLDASPPIRDVAPYALQLLDEAAAVSPDMLAVASVKASLLRSEGRADEALDMINGMMKKRADFAPYLLRAQHYAATGKLDLAEKDYELMTAVRDAPPDAFIAQVQFLRGLNKTDPAIASLQRGLDKYPDNDGLKVQLMRLLLSREAEADRQRGRKLLDELLTRNPNSSDLLWVRAGLLRGEPTEAAQREATALLERVIKLSPRAVPAHLELIRMALAAGDAARAQRQMTQALVSNPDDAGLLVQRAQMEWTAGRTAVARQIVSGVIGQPAGKMDAATRVDAHLLAARLDHAAQKTDAAIGGLEALARGDAGKQFASVWMTLSDLYRFKGDVPNAERCFASAQQIDPNGELIVLGQMQMFAARKDFAGLASFLNDYRAKHAGQAAVLLGGATLLASAEDDANLRTARGVVETVLRDNPKSAEAYLVLAHINYQLKDSVATEQAYHRLLEVDPENSQGLNDLAWITAVDKNDAKTGLELATRGLDKHPGNIHLLDTRGVILTRMNRLDEAQKDLMQCVVLAKDAPQTQGQALLHLARVQVQRGAKAEAMRSLDQARDLDSQTKGRVFSEKERAEIEELKRQAR